MTARPQQGRRQFAVRDVNGDIADRWRQPDALLHSTPAISIPEGHIRSDRRTGFAGRITVNAAIWSPILRSSSFHQTCRDRGRRCDAAEFHLQPAHQRHRLPIRRPPASGQRVAPFSGSLPTFVRQVLSQQGDAADVRGQSQAGAGHGPQFAATAIRCRAPLSISMRKWSNLVSLQNSYAANARVLSTVQDMFDTLLKM